MSGKKKEPTTTPVSLFSSQSWSEAPYVISGISQKYLIFRQQPGFISGYKNIVALPMSKGIFNIQPDIWETGINARLLDG